MSAGAWSTGAVSGALSCLGGLPLLFGRHALAQPGNEGSANALSPGDDSYDWRRLSQQELDAAYAQNNWASNMTDVLARYAANSDRLRARLGEPERHAYGDTPVEMLDLYRANAPAAPIHVFVHGGGWFAGSAREHGFLAGTFVGAGAHFIALDFASAGDTEGDLRPLVDQLRRAIGWISRNADALGGDAARIYLSGHSSGGHLAAVLLTTDWSELGLPADVIKGGVCVSGMFDLEPVGRSSRRDRVNFDEQIVADLSPARHIAELRAPLVLGYGTLESPEFQRQSRDFAGAVRTAGKSVQLLQGEFYNHFEILETLSNPYGLLGRAALVQMQLG